MKCVGIIPARWASTRLEGKVLAKIAGKPMIQHVWERARKSEYLDEVFIACDATHVLKHCQEFGAKAILTAADHPSGTTRVCEAVENIDCEVVINIQGDEPLIDPAAINALAHVLLGDKNLHMGSVFTRLESPQAYMNPNVVKVVLTHDQFALYFSRSPIPNNRDGVDFDQLKVYKHLGLYGYRKEFLQKIPQLPQSVLEQTERLEQLRVLEAGFKIKMVQVKSDSIGVDTAEDLQTVEERLTADGTNS